MQFSVSVSDLGIDPRKSRGAVQSALAMFGRYFSHRVKQRFESEGPGWTPRKEESSAAAMRSTKIRGLAEHKLKRKLEKELVRAERRLSGGKGTFAAAVRKKAVLGEFNRQLFGGVIETGRFQGKKKDKTIAAFLRGEGASRRLQKSVVGLQTRMRRAEASASGKILGRSGSSVYSKLSRGVYELGSRIPWFGAQNEGATVGHGAKIPSRPAIYVEDVDVEVLLEILVNKAINSFG